MFWGMLRDDGNRMANLRHAHKVKVKRREDKVWKVSDYAPVRRLENRTLGRRRRRIGERRKGEEEEELMEKRMWFPLREIFREKIGTKEPKRIIRGIAWQLEQRERRLWRAMKQNEIKSEMGSSTWLSTMSSRCSKDIDV